MELRLNNTENVTCTSPRACMESGGDRRCCNAVGFVLAETQLRICDRSGLVSQDTFVMEICVRVGFVIDRITVVGGEQPQTGSPKLRLC
ncbi:hypothetical protein Zmor_010477 [Zophobas morio]|uniref:Uncharacterized protein n=1 Tax=Zophobas morio TaxID=2755281 RepID=A0AA38IP54_9CUCU|nr:hypothetical protein Zmor_010477 [Zophobas morio]